MEEILYNRFFGVITKLTKIAENKYVDKYGTVTDLEKKAMLGETSPNIIDLIKEGDYVNGKRVYFDKIEYKLYVGNDYDNETFIKDMDIKTVLTKEQYEANCCEV